jgi:cyclin B
VRPKRDVDVQRACVGSEAEYAEDIFHAALRQEKQHRPQQLSEGAITPKMHSVLVDWLAEVHLKFQCRAETLFGAVSLLDRYLAKASPPRDRLQLVGVTALFVAAKYEEVFAPELRDFVYVTDRAYRRDEILQCEVDMLTTLKWRIFVPSPMYFLQRFAHLMGLGITEDKFYLAQYFAELSLPDVRFAKLAPSLIASAALLLANKVVKSSPSWPRPIAAVLPYQETEVKAIAKQLVELLGADSAVKRKFSSRAFHQVAKLIA